METFICSKCGKEKQSEISGGTGYGMDSDGNKYCYDCCAIEDRKHMLAHDKILMYLTYEIPNEGSMRKLFPVGTLSCNGHVSNWPDSLRFPIHSVRIGRHNVTRWRYDVWFDGPEGTKWHGVQYGDNTQIVHCKKLKRK